MPLGTRPTCSSCKTNYSSMWKKRTGEDILCNSCFVRQTGSSTSGSGKEENGQNGNSSSNSKGDGNGIGPVLRKSTRLKPSKNRFQPITKSVATKGKSRRIIFKKSVDKQKAKKHRLKAQENGKRYRAYDNEDIIKAYNAVKNDNMSVAKAACCFGVPAQTLRDRVLGKVSIGVVSSGTHPAFTMVEEAVLVEHLIHVVRHGISFSRRDITDIASEYAIHIGKRSEDKPLTLNWYRKFVNRWPQIRHLYPPTLNTKNYKILPIKAVSNYFDELHLILTKYDLMDKPHYIFNVDELTITEDCDSSHVCVETDYNPQADNSDVSQLATIIGGGSASGMALPPYFVFKDSKMLPEMLTHFSPGASGEVSAGLSCFEVFKRYLEHHFLRLIPERKSGQHILLLLDGHKSHMSYSLLEWAKTKNIAILFIPGDSSYLLQPLDVGCYNHFQLKFVSKCRKSLGKTFMKTLRNHICQPACQLYSQSLSSKKLKYAFSKTGIHPYNRAVICEAFDKAEKQTETNSDEQKDRDVEEDQEFCIGREQGEIDEDENPEMDSVEQKTFVEQGGDTPTCTIMELEPDGELGEITVGTQQIIDLKGEQDICVGAHVIHLNTHVIDMGIHQVLDMGIQHEVQISMQQEMDLGAQQEIGLEETG